MQYLVLKAKTEDTEKQWFIITVKALAHRIGKCTISNKRRLAFQ